MHHNRLISHKNLLRLIELRMRTTHRIRVELSRIGSVTDLVVRKFAKANRKIELSVKSESLVSPLWIQGLKIEICFREVKIRSMGRKKMDAMLRHKTRSLCRKLAKATGHSFLAVYETGPSRVGLHREGEYDPIATVSLTA